MRILYTHLMRLLIITFVMALSVPAFAQSWDDAKIRVIDEEGGVQEFEIPMNPAAAEEEGAEVPPSEPEVAPEAKVSLPPVPPIVADPVFRAPVPPRKPHREKSVREEVQEVQQQPARPLTKMEATAIALENAPPARSFVVRSRVLDGRPVYTVIFKTDTGPYEILVDGLSGDIVSVP